MATKLPSYLQRHVDALSEPAPIASVTKDGSVSYAVPSTAQQIEPVPAVPAYSPLDTSLRPILSIVPDDSLLGTSGLPTFAPTEPEQPPVAVAQSMGDQILGALKSIGSNLLDTIKTTATSAVRGGLEGATVTSAGAASGARVGATGSSLNFALIVVAVLLAVVLLKKR